MANPQNLRKGGKPGNKGGTGRPPEEIRRKFREILAGAGTERIEKIVTREEEGDVLRAVDMLGKYGLGEANVLLENDTIITKLADVLAKYVSKDVGAQILADLQASLAP